MSNLASTDEAYLRIKEMKSVIFSEHTKESETIEYYCKFIKSELFAEMLLMWLKVTLTYGGLDEDLKDNILKILFYVIINTPNISSIHQEMIHDSIRLLNNIEKNRYDEYFYNMEYEKRNPYFLVRLMAEFSFIIDDKDDKEFRQEIKESIRREFAILNSLLYTPEKTFVVDNALEYIHCPYFLDTVNAVLKEWPDLFKYDSFRGKVIYILENNMKVRDNKSDLYEPIEDTLVSRLTLTKTSCTRRRIERLRV